MASSNTEVARQLKAVVDFAKTNPTLDQLNAVATERLGQNLGGQVVQNISLGGIVGGIARIGKVLIERIFPGSPSGFVPGPIAVGCELIRDTQLKAACIAAARAGQLPGPTRPTGPPLPPIPQPFPGTGPCPDGSFPVGNTCFDVGAALPGGDPFFFPQTKPVTPGPTTLGTGQVVQGGFGLPAVSPAGISRLVRRCGPRMVLGIDNLCYPKAVLPPRSKFRKWRRAPRPVVSRRDEVAIKRAASARERVFNLAKDVGLHVAKSPHRKKK